LGVSSEKMHYREVLRSRKGQYSTCAALRGHLSDGWALDRTSHHGRGVCFAGE